MKVKNPYIRQVQLKGNASSYQERLVSFYDFFPKRTSMVSQIQNLFATAKKYHLTLENGSYELIRGDAYQLTRCEVQLPIRGSYVQTRKFRAELLQDMPNAALSAVDIHREKIGDAVVDAQIKLILYYRES